MGGSRQSSHLNFINGYPFHGFTVGPGQVGQKDGGDGYCGGGGQGYDNDNGGDGGTDGGDGDNGSIGRGGEGTGQDISTYTFRTWTLTPGAGGGRSEDNAGGGGGVLVDGAGPDANNYQGRGFGGGGSGYNDDGLQGVILIEITSDE